jgi:hypothetical protein
MSIANLLATNVNEHVEKKLNLSYLSWSWAWEYALKADQKATYKVETFDEYGPNGQRRTVPYMSINSTAMVMVTVTIFDKPMTCQLPVMDHRNKAVPNPDAFQVNTAIMRCMTKALALHGLGLYIFSGEDLPTPYEKVEEKKEKGDPKIKLAAMDGIGDDLSKEDKEFLLDLAASATELVEAGKAENALNMLREQNLDPDARIFVDRHLASNIKTAIRKAGTTTKE